jgi:hypothetical protein
MKRLVATAKQYDRDGRAAIPLESDPRLRGIALASDPGSPCAPMCVPAGPAKVAETIRGGPMAPRRTQITIALLAATALVAACGDSKPASDTAQTLTKAQVIARGGAICRAAEKRAENLPEPRAENPFARGTSASVRRDAVTFLNGYADALDSTRVGLGRLAAPAQDRALLDGYIAGVAEAVAKFRQAAADASPHAMKLANEGFAIFDQISKKTAAYGFPKGVCGSGEAS